MSADGEVHSDPGEQEDFFQADLFIDRSYTLKEMDVNHVKVLIQALHSSASTDFDLTGQIVWPASKLLSLYVTSGTIDLDGQRVLELGSGVGLGGLAAARMTSRPDRVVLTDNQEEVLDVLDQNVVLNYPHSEDKARPQCAYLGWGENVEEFLAAYGAFDLIIGADVVFWPSAVPLLFDTAQRLLAEGTESQLVISYVSRSDFSTKLMYRCAAESGFKWRDVPIDSNPMYAQIVQDQVDCGRKASLLIFTRDENHPS